MAVAMQRDIDTLRDQLSAWFGARLATDVTIADLTVPTAGFSNETALCDVTWTAADGDRRTRGVVLRIEATSHVVFLDPDVLRQCRVMDALAGAAVAAPTVWLVEPDPALLGARFFVMDRVPGRVPSDEPSLHRAGWVADLAPADRARLYEHGLAELVRLHGVDWRRGFDFLATPGRSPLDAYLDSLSRWWDASRLDVTDGRAVLTDAFAHAMLARPADHAAETTVLWGDARVGNMIFDDELRVAALIDWENASVGPPGIDLAWWLLFEENLCEAQGLARPPGAPDREATIARYEELSGRDMSSIGYYEVLAGISLLLITSRLRPLLVRAGVRPHVAGRLVQNSARMLRDRLDRVA